MRTIVSVHAVPVEYRSRILHHSLRPKPVQGPDIAYIFSPWKQYRDPDQHRPVTILQSAREDETGLRWILFVKASPDWVPKKPQPDDGEDQRAYMIRYDDHVDSVLEVVDPETGALIARRHFTTLLSAEMMGRNLLFVSQTQDQRGNLSAHVWRAELHEDDGDRQTELLER